MFPEMQLSFHDAQYLGLGIVLTGSNCPLYSRFIVCWAALVPGACCLSPMLQLDVDLSVFLPEKSESAICSASSRLHQPVRNAARMWHLTLLLLRPPVLCLLLQS